MRVISAEVINFGSYKQLSFNFERRGLNLVHGATGSGKSTLCDIIPWTLFGTTAKNGSVNDILAWNADGPTIGKIVVETNKQTVCAITRIRGKSNDLYYEDGMGWYGPRRGKDLVDTQRLINNLLGLTPELYLSGAYFHEFSQIASFFTTTAKNRREICEQLVDLSLAKKLQVNASIINKELAKTVDKVNTEINICDTQIHLLENLKAQNQVKWDKWQVSQKAKITDIKRKRDDFEEDKYSRLIDLADSWRSFEEKRESDIMALEKEQVNPVCASCGQLVALGSHKHAESLQIRRLNLQASRNPYQQMMEQEESRQNDSAEQLKIAEAEENPHDSAGVDVELVKASKTKKQLESQNASSRRDFTDSSLLLDIVANFRAAVVRRTITEIESNTNDLLTKHFDSEIRIALMITEGDKLEVTIQKDGNECVYTQLSKGQRQLLKLCFGVTVMRTVSNHHGIQFNAIFFDEAFDGLSEDFKIKAFNLLSSLALSYESVFVVEHSETLKPMFENQIKVQLENGNSVVYE